MHITVSAEPPPPMMEPAVLRNMRASHIDPLTGEDEMAAPAPGAVPRALPRDRDVAVDANDPSTWGKVQRNAACPCGSGRKFKHCHGALV
ncbi:MAG TPA: SEC-C domain-containing protein [Rhizomicrobium sp.]|nr:SEC-C domain-containing protein [Rhizomicrobium sp.]